MKAESAEYALAMDVELDPPQPPEVVAALAELVLPDAPAPDRWWQAGSDDSLET